MMSQPETATTHLVQLGGLEPPTSWHISVLRCSWHFCGFPTIAKTLVLHALLIESVSPAIAGDYRAVVPWWFLGARKWGLEMRDRRITKKLVDRLRPAGADYFVWDKTLIGFGVRVQPTGSMSYIAKYRAGSGRGAPTRRVTLGRVGTLTPDEARTLARKTLGAVAHGNDPAALRAAERRASTLRELAEIFLTEHVEAKRKRTTATHYRSLLEKVVLPELGSRKAEQVTTFDLAKLHAKMRNRPYQANRMLEVVGSLYSFAGKRK